ncbi:MFS transporter [Sphingomonas profundi]|uniref:MFS transporter n=1 Tax=Alterirhizorhabdus profundi TaxID=2681549 RepID=UPI001E5A753A|nr:MFS transporter [Sphingomonas profundi]
MADGRADAETWSEADDTRLFRKVSLRLIPFLMLCYAVAYLDRVNVGFAKLGMSEELGFGEAAYGLGAGIFFIGYFLFEVPSNAILHRVGARIWIARIMISWSVVSASCALVQGPISFYCVRFLLGIAEAGFFPGIILYLTYWFPAARRGQIVALFMVAIPLAGMVGGPLSGFIMQSLDGALGWGGWRWMFVIEAVPALLLGLMIPLILSSRVEDARWLTPRERARVAHVVRTDMPTDATSHASLRDLVSDPLILRFALIYFCCVMGQYGVTFWLPTLVAAAAKGSTMQIGLYSALPYACAVVAMVLVCRHSDRVGERRWHLAMPMLLGASGLIAAPLLQDQVWLSTTLLCLAAAATLTATPMFWTLPTATLSGSAAAIGIAAINSIGNLAGFASPLLVGWISDATGSIEAGMMLLAGLLIGGAALVLAMKRPRDAAPDESSRDAVIPEL